MFNKPIIQKQQDSERKLARIEAPVNDKHRVLFMQKVMGLNECIEYLQNQRKKKLNNG